LLVCRCRTASWWELQVKGHGWGCTPVRRVALIACLAHKARMRVRDDLATMFCKRIATKIKKAKAELEEIRLAEREIVEALIGNYRTVLKHIDEGGPTQEALSKQTEYVHIGALFGEPGKHVIDFDLIESQFRHLMRVAVSAREGAISSSWPHGAHIWSWSPAARNGSARLLRSCTRSTE
jgi:hypothetical protein